MTAHTFQLKQDSTVLVNFTDTTNYYYSLQRYSINARGKPFVTSPIRFTIRGTSKDVLFDKVIALQRALSDARDNYYRMQQGQAYTPIWLQFQDAAATNLVQSEFFGIPPEEDWRIDDLLTKAMLSNRIPDIELPLYHRGYFEETAAVAVSGSPFTANNNGALMAITNTDVRGDLPAPLKVQVRTGAAGVTRLLAALKTQGTVANFVSKYEAEGYAARGSGVADLTDATFSGTGAPQGQRWTPGATSEQLLLRFTITSNVLDQYGFFRVLVACKDNSASTVNVKLRVKPFVYSGSTYQYGAWGGNGQQVQPALVGARTLVDCDVIKLPAVDAANVAVSGMGFEIWGQAAATGTSHYFDLDNVYLVPAYEGAGHSGQIIAVLPLALGTAGQPDGVIDALDRVAPAYEVDGSAVLLFPSNDVRGESLLAFPARASKLLVIADVNNGAHDQTVNNTVTVTYMPRYTLARGS